MHSGGGSRIRTYDLLIKSQLLYQLSYTPKRERRDVTLLCALYNLPCSTFTKTGNKVVGRARLELATNGLKVRCSTD